MFNKSEIFDLEDVVIVFLGAGSIDKLCMTYIDEKNVFKIDKSTCWFYENYWKLHFVVL